MPGALSAAASWVVRAATDGRSLTIPYAGATVATAATLGIGLVAI